MQKNHFWILLIILFSLIALGYTVSMGIALWQYHRLDSRVEVQYIQWSIFTSNEEAYTPIGHYAFMVNGKKYTGKSAWSETYLNQWAAEEAIDKLKKERFQIWYHSTDPENSSLIKEFPTKKVLYSIMLWALAIYFLGIGYYTARR